MAEEQSFTYKALDANGATFNGMISASARTEAMRKLAKDGMIVLELREAKAPSSRTLFKSNKISTTDRVLLLRQLSLLVKAGIDLLDAIDTVAAGMEGPVATQLRAVGVALRRGDRLVDAFSKNSPGFPDYVYALIGAGEASGALARVLEDAATLLAFDERVRRDVMTSLTYPLFLICAGAGAIGFLFYEVVPRFSAMIGASREKLTGLSAFVLGAGDVFRANAVLILAVLIAVILMASAAISQPAGRRALYGVARGTPVVGALMASRERAIWARIMSFALGSGVPILEAADLSSRSIPGGRLRQRLNLANRAIRAGKPVDEAFGESGILQQIDRSLLKAGQRSGQLPAMFGFMGARHEDNLKDDLKRATALVEPIAISIVAVAIGAVAIGLVTAMSSVYETIG